MCTCTNLPRERLLQLPKHQVHALGKDRVATALAQCVKFLNARQTWVRRYHVYAHKQQHTHNAHNHIHTYTHIYTCTHTCTTCIMHALCVCVCVRPAAHQKEGADLSQADMLPIVTIGRAVWKADVVAGHPGGGVKGGKEPRGEVVHLVKQTLVLVEVECRQQAPNHADVDPEWEPG